MVMNLIIFSMKIIMGKGVLFLLLSESVKKRGNGNLNLLRKPL